MAAIKEHRLILEVGGYIGKGIGERVIGEVRYKHEQEECLTTNNSPTLINRLNVCATH